MTMTDRWWPQIRLWAGVAIGGLCLWLAFRDIPLRDVLVLLRKIDLGMLGLALVSVIATTLAKTARWRWLFYPLHYQLRYAKLLAIVFVGQMVNILVPARFGEMARAYMIREIEGQSMALALGTIVIEKLLDLAAVGILTVLLVPAMALPTWVWIAGRALIVASATLIGATVVVAVQRHRVVSAIGSMAAYWPAVGTRLARQVQLALGSMACLSDRRIAGRIIIWTITIWLISILAIYLTFLAMKMSLPALAAGFLLVVGSLGVAVPSSPGRLGVFHYLCVLALSAFDVPRVQAVSFSLVLYMLLFVTPIVLGVSFLWRESLDWRSLRRGTYQLDEPTGVVSP